MPAKRPERKPAGLPSFVATVLKRERAREDARKATRCAQLAPPLNRVGLSPITVPTSPTPETSESPPSDISALLPINKGRNAPKIIPSDFRPNVPAGDRIFAWDTPYAIRHRHGMKLPVSLQRSCILAVLGGLAGTTRTTYGAGILRFTQFCDTWRIPEDDRMPASYPLLCAFLGSIRGKAAPGTMNSYMSGIRAWHVFHHAPWHGDDSWVTNARSAVSKAGSHLTKPPRAPVSLEHLVVLRRELDLATPLHAAIWAVAVVTFFGCRRLGETVVAGKFEVKKHVTRRFAGVRFKQFRGNVHSASFDIPWTKTTKEKGATVIVTQRTDELAINYNMCPVWALRNHLNINSGSFIPDSATLFAYRTGSDTWEDMTRKVFLDDTVKPIWHRARLQYVTGHSFRIGGAVALLLAGVPPEVVAATGGWTSLAFLLYWRRVEEVIPLCTSKAYKKSHLDDLAEIFEQFRINNKLPDYLSTSNPDDN